MASLCCILKTLPGKLFKLEQGKIKNGLQEPEIIIDTDSGVRSVTTNEKNIRAQIHACLNYLFYSFQHSPETSVGTPHREIIMSWPFKYKICKETKLFFPSLVRY